MLTMRLKLAAYTVWNREFYQLPYILTLKKTNFVDKIGTLSIVYLELHICAVLHGLPMRC